MARPVVARSTFYADVIYLYRLLRAVEVDTQRPPEFRDQVLDTTRTLIKLLSDAPALPAPSGE